MAICVHYDDADNYANLYFWDPTVPMCNVGDVLLNGPQDLESHFSAKECIKVLRVIDAKASDWFYRNVIEQTGQARHQAFTEACGYVWDHFGAHALPFSDYNLNPEEELMQMSVPNKATKAAPAKEKAPKEPKVPAKSALEKWADKNGFTMDSTIGYGADKEGKAYSKENCPKRGASAERWKASYKDGMTLAEYAKAGGRKDDLDWDTAASRGWIKVSK